MEDNPSLTPAIRERYRRLYSGVFYRRYILGEWVQAEGRVYDFFTADMVAEVPKGEGAEWYISCDYGTVNPTSMGLWGRFGEVWYRVREFYFSSRRENRQLTDEEYADALENLAGGREIRAVIVDPSAASFQETLRRRGLRGPQGGQRCAFRHPAHGGRSENRENTHLRYLRRLPAGNGRVRMGSVRRREGPGEEGK